MLYPDPRSLVLLMLLLIFQLAGTSLSSAQVRDTHDGVEPNRIETDDSAAADSVADEEDPAHEELDTILVRMRGMVWEGAQSDDRTEQALEFTMLLTDWIDTHIDHKVRARGFIERGRCYQFLQRYDAAIEDYSRVGGRSLELEALTPWQKETLDGVEARALLGHGACLLKLHQWDAARQQFENCVSQYPKSDALQEALYRLGIALRELGLFDQARNQWERLTAGSSGSSLSQWARRATEELGTLRDPRERLREIGPRVLEEKQHLLKLPKSERRREKNNQALRDVLESLSTVRCVECERFLRQQFEDSPAEVAELIVKPLLEVAGPESGRFLLGKLPSLQLTSQREVLRGLQARHLRGVSFSSLRDNLSQRGVLLEETLRLLGRVGNQEACEMLLEAIRTPSGKQDLPPESVVANGIIARQLRGVRDKGVWSWLIEAVLANPKQPQLVRAMVAEAAGYASFDGAEQQLLDLLRENGVSVPSAAAASLGRLRAQEAVQPIAAQLQARKKSVIFARAAIEALGRLDPTPVVDLLLTFLRSRDVATRTLVVRALGQTRLADAQVGIIGSIEDEAWQVRRSALRSLRPFPSVAAVDSLIERLQREEGALLPDLMRILITFTGQDFGTDVQAWRDYWKVAREEYKPEDFALGTEGAQTKTFVKRADAGAVDTPQYFGVDIISKRLAFIVDISGSMRAKVSVSNSDGGTSESTRMELAKRELVGAIKKLRNRTFFNIIKFETSFTPMAPKLIKLSKKNVRNAIQFAEGLQPLGGTNIYDSLESVLIAGEVDTIFLLSDGAPSAGKYTDTRLILDEVRRLNATSQVTINTIALGAPSPFLEDLAAQNDGTYVLVGSR